MIKIFKTPSIILIFFALLLLVSFFIPSFRAVWGDSNGNCPGVSEEKQEKIEEQCEPCDKEDWGGLVPCGRYCNDPNTDMNECCPCTLCHAFVFINRLLLFLRNAAFLVATILIVAGGAMMLLSGAYQGLRAKGKSIVTSAVTGLIIILLAWVVTASVLVVLAGRTNAEKYFNLKTASFKIQCTAD